MPGRITSGRGRRALCWAAVAGALLLGACADKELPYYRPDNIQSGYAVVEIGEGAEVRAVDGEAAMAGNDYWWTSRHYDNGQARELYGSPGIRNHDLYSDGSGRDFTLGRYRYGRIVLSAGEHRLDVAAFATGVDPVTGKFSYRTWPATTPLAVRFLSPGTKYAYEVDSIRLPDSVSDREVVVLVILRRYKVSLSKHYTEIVASNLPQTVGMSRDGAAAFVGLVVKNRQTGEYSDAQLKKLQQDYVARNREKIREIGWQPHPR